MATTIEELDKICTAIKFYCSKNNSKNKFPTIKHVIVIKPIFNPRTSKRIGPGNTNEIIKRITNGTNTIIDAGEGNLLAEFE